MQASPGPVCNRSARSKSASSLHTLLYTGKVAITTAGPCSQDLVHLIRSPIVEHHSHLE